jgi:hypothetical protein
MEGGGGEGQSKRKQNISKFNALKKYLTSAATSHGAMRFTKTASRNKVSFPYSSLNIDAFSKTKSPFAYGMSFSVLEMIH